MLAGERRFRASKIAGLDLVPAIIKELTDQEMMRQAIIENLQREDLNPIEEAISYQKLVDHGYKHDQIAQFMGKSRPYISNMLRLLHLALSVQEAVIQMIFLRLTRVFLFLLMKKSSAFGWSESNRII